MAHDHSGHDHVWADDLTRNQELVLGTLAHATAPMSAYDILDKLRGDGLRAPLQIYRALEKLTERAVEQKLTGWSKAAGFVPSRMTIELRGTCRDCASSSPA